MLLWACVVLDEDEKHSECCPAQTASTRAEGLHDSMGIHGKTLGTKGHIAVQLQTGNGLRIFPEMAKGYALRNVNSCKTAQAVMGRETSMRRVCLLLALFGMLASSYAQAGEPSQEYLIKAGFLYRFLMFTEWPAQAKAPDTIGILGDAPFGNAFDTKQGLRIEDRTLVVKYFPSDVPPVKLGQCQLLFISASSSKRIREILQGLGNRPVLTVSEVAGFGEKGGMINLVTKKNTVGFEINRAAAERVGIKLRSKLLRLAVRIVDQKP